MSFVPYFTATADLTQIERTQRFLEAMKLSLDSLRKIGSRRFILDAHDMSQIGAEL